MRDLDYLNRIKGAKVSVLQRLKRLQFEAPEKVLLIRQDPLGLGAQISRRILGLRLGLYYGRTVVCIQDDDWPYTQSFQRQYASHLQPPAWDATPDFDFDEPDRSSVAKFNFWKWWDDPAKNSRFLEAVPPELEDVPEASRVYDGILFSFLQLQPAMETYVNQEGSRLGIDDSMIGVHVRRGDKSVETPYIPIDIVRKEIIRLLDVSGRSKIFLATDDPDVYGQLLPRARYEIIFDQTECRYNNANHRLLMKRPELAEAETKTAIKNIMLLARCHMVLGQTNAHFASLAASAICCSRNTVDYGHLIPGDHALRTSRIRRVLFWITRQPRTIAKRMLPSFSVRALRRDR